MLLRAGRRAVPEIRADLNAGAGTPIPLRLYPNLMPHLPAPDSSGSQCGLSFADFGGTKRQYTAPTSVPAVGRSR